MVEQDAAPAGVPRKARARAASELRPAVNTGCPPGAWLTADKHAVLNPRKARPMPEEERRDGAPGGARVLERERGTKEQWLRHLARHPLAFAGGKKRDHGVPGAAKNTGDDACHGEREYVSRAQRSTLVVRCRPGTVANSAPGMAPDQRCTTSCCTASGALRSGLENTM